ncbi:hypothetical protein [Pedobacter ghigonis]|uniref:hypothetical protein n=1 Tax=Pedobacter ghigonis TaxID=2730403 RepID=UPI00158C8D14|nr:hypothetical protein [Pedobacter ghigonis]
MKEKSFDYANEALKLILTLATGVLAFTLTFMKDMIGEEPIQYSFCLYLSWFLMVSCIAFCLWGIFAIIGTANNIGANATSSTDSVYSKNITFPAVSAIMLFVLGMVFMIIFTLRNFPTNGRPAQKKIESKTIATCCRDTVEVVVQLNNTAKKAKIIRPHARTKKCKPKLQRDSMR